MQDHVNILKATRSYFFLFLRYTILNKRQQNYEVGIIKADLSSVSKEM